MEMIPELKAILVQPRTPEELNIPVALVFDLIYRLLFGEREVSVVRMSEVTCVANQVLDPILSQMQLEHLIEVAKTGALGRLSYTYRLTEEGNKRARSALERSSYIGPAPVNLESYSSAILIQTKQENRIAPSQVKRALSSLVLPENFHRRIGPVVNAGTSLFLYGPPGNGKTTVAEICGELLSASEPIWLPHALTVGGQIIKIHDPLIHIQADVPERVKSGKTGHLGRKSIDKRWSLFKRPVVMAGGELKMDSLDLRFEPYAKFYEAPLQLKANGGMFLIDDFGRQTMRPDELLNRWILPLEKRFDFLNLPNGKKITVPFDQLIIFSTNLEPRELVDEAFLRRIPYKIEVVDPTEDEFRELFRMMIPKLGFEYRQGPVDYLIDTYYRKTGRPFRCCHPRDLLLQVRSLCAYRQHPPELTDEFFDMAVDNYFAVM